MLLETTYCVLPWPATVGGASIGVGTNNNVSLIRVYIPAPMTVSQIIFGTTVQFIGHNYGFGLYDLDGNLFLDSGPVTSPSTNIHGKYAVSITPVQIGSGVCWLAYTCDSSNDSFEPIATPDIVTSLVSDGTAIIAHATNPSVAGQLPSTTGTITLDIPSGSSIAPLVKLQS